MKQSQKLIFLIVIFLAACGPTAATYNNDGNEAFEAENYDEAVNNYTLSQQEDPDLAQPYYNAGNAFHRQGNLEAATAQTQQALRTAEEELAQYSYYNLGNTHFRVEDWPSAIEAYQEALRLNPDDIDAKHNLELALQNLQQQMQQQQQQQQGDQGEQPNQGENNQQGDQQQPGGQDGDQQEPGGGGQQPQPDQPPSSGSQPQDQSDQPGNSDGSLSPEEALQLLDALGQNNQTLQERLQEEFFAPGPPPAQDW